MAELAEDEKVERKGRCRATKPWPISRDIGEAYKAEIIAAIPANEDVSLYPKAAGSTCRGLHVPSTGEAAPSS